jgi:AcrR family transcriptional regulator/DNA-binding MarR family transcriptional regulator
MLSAVFEVCAERGAARVTVHDVVVRAGVSRRTFYELFASCEECVLAALDSAIAEVAERVGEAVRGPLPWRERMRVGLLALLRFLDEEPFMGRLLVVEALGAGPAALERRSRIVGALAAAVAEGSRETGAAVHAPPLMAEGIVGGVLSVIHTRMVAAEQRSLHRLVNPLMSMIVLPYLGPAASQEELARKVVVRRPAPRPVRNPLGGLELRLTYRTIRVLVAVGERPGSSNRDVGRLAGIDDQGQISKLLARLERVGLVENTRDRNAAGTANAWRLTERGRELRFALARTA